MRGTWLGGSRRTDHHHIGEFKKKRIPTNRTSKATNGEEKQRPRTGQNRQATIATQDDKRKKKKEDCCPLKKRDC